MAVLLLFVGTASAVEVRIEGERTEQISKLLKRLQVTNGTTLAANPDSVRNLLMKEGHLDAAATLVNDTLRVSAGPLYLLTEMVVDSAENDRFSFTVPFTEVNVRSVIDDILRAYHARGYYYARATIGSIARDENKVTIHLELIPGPLVTLNQVTIEGLQRTRDETVLRDLEVGPGDTLTDRLIDRLEVDAREIRYVEYVPSARVKPLSGYNQADVELRFRERQQLIFSGGIGYQNEQEQGLLWDLSMQMPNLFGEGKQVSLQSERSQKGRNHLYLSYRQPARIVGRSEVMAELSTRDFRDDFYEFALNIGLDIRLSRGTTAGLTVGWKRVEPVDSSGYSRYAVGVGFGRHDLDFPQNPTSGYALRSSVLYAYRSVDADSLSAGRSYSETRAELEVSHYFRLIGPVVLATGVGYHGVESEDDELPVSELILFGGPGSIRGFQSEQFAARRGVTASFEPRVRFDGGHLFAFWDGALMQTSSGGGIEEIYRQGFGGGITLATAERSIQLSLGWNRDLAIDQPFLSVAFLSGL
ncbi:MAG: BamA/TamA family outer membrane protein [bacterium]|nr:BamA/TamA family outer membrane protein [bacterium]